MSTASENDFYPVASAVAEILEAARKHAPEAVERASGLLDMSCASSLRGVAYLAFLVEQYDATDRHKAIARNTLAEVTALFAVLLELENLGDTNKAFRRFGV